MRSLVIFLAVLLIPVSALALTDDVVSFCFTEPNPQQCITKSIQEEEKAAAAQIRLHGPGGYTPTNPPIDRQQQALDAQLETARIQANGMAMFGAGNAMVNGINQGFQNMQQPYVSTPGFSYGHQRK